MSLLQGAADLTSSTEFWSAIVGSLVGGGIGFTVQIIGLREARHQRRIDRLSKDRALAGALLFKLIRMYSNIVHVRSHVESGILAAEENGQSEDRWAHILAAANPPADIHLDPEEMGMLFSQGDMAVSNKVLALDSRHNALLDALRAYGEKRQLVRRYVPATTAQETRLSSALSREEYAAFLPLKIELDTLVEQIRKKASEEVFAFHTAIKDAQALLTRSLALSFGFEVAPPTLAPALRRRASGARKRSDLVEEGEPHRAILPSKRAGDASSAASLHPERVP